MSNTAIAFECLQWNSYNHACTSTTPAVRYQIRKIWRTNRRKKIGLECLHTVGEHCRWRIIWLFSRDSTPSFTEIQFGGTDGKAVITSILELKTSETSKTAFPNQIPKGGPPSVWVICDCWRSSHPVEQRCFSGAYCGHARHTFRPLGNRPHNPHHVWTQICELPTRLISVPGKRKRPLGKTIDYGASDEIPGGEQENTCRQFLDDRSDGKSQCRESVRGKTNVNRVMCVCG